MVAVYCGSSSKGSLISGVTCAAAGVAAAISARANSSVLIVLGLLRRRRLRRLRLLGQLADAHDLSSRERLHHGLHERVLLDLGAHLALLALLLLPQALGAAAALRRQQPPLAGPFL